jgi:hypothetical protein
MPMYFKLELKDTEPTKGTASLEVDANLGELTSALVNLMEQQEPVKQILISAVDQYREKNSTHP